MNYDNLGGVSGGSTGPTSPGQRAATGPSATIRPAPKVPARRPPVFTFQEIVMALDRYWNEQGCLIVFPYDMEKGAGTMNPNTFFRALGPEPWKVAYVEPSRRPADARYGENPNRVGYYYQYQVILKPSPDDVVELYLKSLEALGIDPRRHDIRLVEDNWEAPTLAAWGLGWEVWLDGMEVTQFTYFQQVGGLEARPVSAEITYGLERMAMYIQGVDNFWDIMWNDDVSYGEMAHRFEVEHSVHGFETADVAMLLDLFTTYEREANRLIDAGLVFPAYDYVLKCSHTFNLLDARGAISVTERTKYLGRVRTLSRRCAKTYLDGREAAGFPLLEGAPKPVYGRALSGGGLPGRPLSGEVQPGPRNGGGRR